MTKNTDSETKVEIKGAKPEAKSDSKSEVKPEPSPLRKRIFTIVEPYKGSDRISRFYDHAMIVVIIFSLIPLMFDSNNDLLFVIDKICVAIFIVDYVLRFITADFRAKAKSATTQKRAFLRYPITPMAIIDLISILPSLTIINNSFKLFRLIRLAKLVRLAKFLRYSKSLTIIKGILKKSYHTLLIVAVASIAYVAIAGLIAFNVEPDEHFDSYLDAMYWVVIVWNLDPASVTGHIIAICSVIFGVAVVALPASIITAEYINKLNRAEHSDDFKKEMAAIEQEIEEDIGRDLKKDIQKSSS